MDTVALIVSLLALLAALRPDTFVDPILDFYYFNVRPRFARRQSR
jgi:hypothetical protein